MTKPFALFLAVLLTFGITASAVQAQNETGDDGTTNWDFIEPVTHLNTVPAGYTPIRTAAELNNIRNNLTGNYILMNNIDLSEWGNWDPIGDYANDKWFEGTLDGNGYTIKHIVMKIKKSTAVYAGLFGRTLENSAVKNVGIIGAVIIAESKDANYSYAGGIAGCSASAISNCFFTGSVKSSTNSAPALAGGIAGDSTAAISNCYNRGGMSGSAINAYIGGITGCSSSAINNCYNAGPISASSSSGFAGGIAGDADSYSSISNCYNTGKVSASSSAITSNSKAGGIAGDSDLCFINNCYNTGAVSAIAFSSFNAAVAWAGGIAGNSYSISNCYNTGVVSITSSTVDYAGGIAGAAHSPISDCYFLNNIQNGVEPNHGTLINVKSLTADQMKQQSSYESFDFDTIWTIKTDEYPTLQTLPVQDEHTTHTPTLITINSTCSMNGIQYTGCEVCGEVFSTIAMLPLKPHIFGEWIIGGVGVLQKCTVCGWEESASISKIEITGKQTLIYKESTKLNVSVILHNGEVINEIPANWSSENPKIVTVDPSNGNITANRAGETNIIATIERQAGDLTATYKVTVKLTFWQWLIKIILFGWIWY